MWMRYTIRRFTLAVTCATLMAATASAQDQLRVASPDGRNEVTVEIANGVKVRVERGLISAVMAKTEPVKGDKKSRGKGKEVAESKGVSGLLAGLFGGGKRT